jgi:hypothetical protein
MNLTNDYVIIAKDASVDANDQMVSINKIIDNLTFGFHKEEFDKAVASSQGKPLAFPIAYSITSSWRSDIKATKNFPFKLNVKLVDPDGVTLSENSQEAVMAEGNNTVRFNINVQGFPVTKPGVYKYILSAIDDQGKQLAKGASQINVDLKAE